MKRSQQTHSDRKEYPRTLAPAAKVQKTGASADMPSVRLEEVLSFLKETRGILSWKFGAMADSLKISEAAAKQVVVILALQGCVKRETHGGETEWLTTLNGETISGSATPRFNLKRVKETLEALATRIRTINRDRRAAFRITKAVAFGDFLSASARVQAADVGVQLVLKKREAKKKIRQRMSPSSSKGLGAAAL